MSEEKEQSPSEEQTQPGGPGHRLREAREARKQSQAEVAAELRMRVAIIEALEADDYSSLPGATFVQGYLRSYARLLGLPEESIIALSGTGGEPEPKLVSTIAEGKEQVSSRDLPVRMVSMLVLALVVVGLGWWFAQRMPAQSESGPEVIAAGTEQGLALPEAMPLASEEADIASEEVVAAESEQETPAEAEAIAETEAELPLEEPKVVEVASAPAPAAAEEGTLPPISDEMPHSVLELSFDHDSWSEISDAAGRRLVYDLVKAGSELTLKGEAPFKIFLGYSKGVTVRYNGEAFDHTALHRGDVARFRVGRAEHNQPRTGE